MATDTETWRITPSNGNVFSDLGFDKEEAENLLGKLTGLWMLN